MNKTERNKHRELPRPGRCAVTGKVRWPDGKAAVEVLHRAQNAAQRGAEFGYASRRREVRHYRCPHCAGFHTTSQPTWVVAA